MTEEDRAGTHIFRISECVKSELFTVKYEVVVVSETDLTELVFQKQRNYSDNPCTTADLLRKKKKQTTKQLPLLHHILESLTFFPSSSQPKEAGSKHT